MARLDAFLVALLIASALSVVYTQHRSRKLVTDYEREQVRSRALEVEWGQLQLESGTWAAHARVEKLARDKLRMQTPSGEALVSLDVVTEGATR